MIATESKPWIGSLVGHPVAVRAIAPRIARVVLGTVEPPDPSWAVLPQEPYPASAEWGEVTLAGNALSVRFGELVASFSALERSDGGMRVTLAIAPGAHVYGLGEKTGYMDRRGRAYTMWNTDDNTPHVEATDALYVSIPFFTVVEGSSAYGVYVDGGRKSRFDVAKTDPGRIAVETEGEHLDLYVFGGPTLAEVLAQHTALTGRMALPPRWALGYHQARWSYESADEARGVVREARKRDIPLDCLWLDIDYMRGYRVFTWDPERFPDPAGLVAECGQQGVKVVTIVDPGIKQDPEWAVFREAMQDRICRYPDGRPFVGEVWPGDCVFPDFSNPEVRRWWGEKHRDFLATGIAGIWNDMNEPALFKPAGDAAAGSHKTMASDVVHRTDRGAKPHGEVHNFFGFWMDQATHEALVAQRPDRRPFLLTRSAFAGIQRHAAIWTGDNFSHWFHLEEAIPMCLHLGLSGVAFVGSDVGGFSGDATGELVARWTQLGCFTPFFRNHTAKHTRSQEPWAFDAEIEAVCRKYIRLRYQLMPYTYTIFEEAAATGKPVMRPMAMEAPGDPEAANLHDQFFWGPDLLVAPATRPAQTHRMVYFPAGEWVEFETGERIVGPRFQVVDAPLDRLPLFVRAGAVLPTTTPASSTGELGPVQTLDVYLPSRGGALAGHLYDDEGEGVGYREGRCDRWRFEGSWQGGAGELALVGEQLGAGRHGHAITVRLHGPEGKREVAATLTPGRIAL